MRISDWSSDVCSSDLRVSITLAAPAPVVAAVEAHHDWIAGEVLATQLTVVDEVGGSASSLVVDEPEVRVEVLVLRSEQGGPGEPSGPGAQGRSVGLVGAFLAAGLLTGDGKEGGGGK